MWGKIFPSVDHNQTDGPRRWWLWGLGLGSLLWLLLRSGSNPRRLAYPCQQAALAGSASFLASVASLLGIARVSRFLVRKTTLGAAGVFGLVLVLTLPLTGGGSPASISAPAGILTLPGWASPTAVSSVFVVSGVPVPECSLDGGLLSLTPPCSDPAYALKDFGVDQLVAEMEARGDHFYETSAHPDGIVGAADVVVIKVNNQWGHTGTGDGAGRLATNTDVLKGLIWRVLQHPAGFTGEVVVAENIQGSGSSWDVTPANSEDRDQSIQDVIAAFAGLGYTVTASDWTDVSSRLISGGAVDGGGYPTGEYAQGNMNDAYILLEDSDSSGTDELSYPKFQTDGGRYVSMRYGVWNGSSYDRGALTLINLPVLKAHGMAGATIAWKNLIGFVTVYDETRRYGSWNEMHDFFWGYTGGSDPAYGLLGRQMAMVCAPDLNLVDAIWVADNNVSGNAVRQDVLMASTDPFAVDWYASEYVLLPSMPWSDQNVSAARSGTFRNATRTNQNAASLLWPGAYPWVDLLDGYDGDTPSELERDQMNIYTVGVVFTDGFEWGDTAAWSATLP